MLEQIKRFAEHNYGLLCSEAPEEAARGVDISFDFKGQSISNPWIDQSARSELTMEQAAATYGVANVIKFCNEINDYIEFNTTSNSKERDYIRNRIDMVLLAYRCSKSPNEAIDTLVTALGLDTAQTCVATLVNCVSLSDGRISDEVRSWAQSVAAAPRHSVLWAMHIYGVDSYIHSAHVDQIGDAMRRYDGNRKA